MHFKPAEERQTNLGAIRRNDYGRTSSAFHLSLRTQKTAPDTELRNPTDLVDQFAFFAGVLLFIPDGAIFRFPVDANAGRKRRNGKCLCINSDCGHKFNLLALEFPKVITFFYQRSSFFRAFRLPFKEG